jgi:hypothetical protein
MDIKVLDSIEFRIQKSLWNAFRRRIAMVILFSFDRAVTRAAGWIVEKSGVSLKSWNHGRHQET